MSVREGGRGGKRVREIERGGARERKERSQHSRDPSADRVLSETEGERDVM